jgi:integrase
MGSIRARVDNGLLFFDFRFQGKRCREQTLLEDTPTNRRRLEKALAKIEADIEGGAFDYEQRFPGSKRHATANTESLAVPAAPGAPAVVLPTTPTLRTFADTWLTNHAVEWRRSHIRVLRSTLDGHLLPHFGEQPIGQISKADILAFRTKLAELSGRGGKGLSAKRINGILAPLKQMLAEAAEMHGFATPAVNIKPLRVKKGDVQPFSLSDVQAIINRARADYRHYFITRFFTGMRTGEVHGLKWKYVDFEHRLILVRETFVLGEDEYTKTDSSQRDIQMSQVVFDALRQQHAATAKLSDYVFCNREGSPLDNKNFSDRVWYPLLRHLGLAARRPYQMRHTAATLWLAAGEAPEWIARQLGHASTEMLFRVYSRYVPNLTRRDGSAIDRLLATRFSTTNVPAVTLTLAHTSAPPGAAKAAAANEPGHEAQPPPVTVALAA